MKGFQAGGSCFGETREFLFSLPRRLRAGEAVKVTLTPEIRAALSTIQVRFNEAVFAGESTRLISGGGSTEFDTTNKLVAKAANCNEASRAGRSLNAARTGTIKCAQWKKLEEVAHVTIKYAGRSQLEAQGLLKSEDDDAAGNIANAAAEAAATQLLPVPVIKTKTGADSKLGKRKSAVVDDGVVDLS